MVTLRKKLTLVVKKDFPYEVRTLTGTVALIENDQLGSTDSL